MFINSTSVSPSTVTELAPFVSICCKPSENLTWTNSNLDIRIELRGMEGKQNSVLSPKNL